MIREEIKRSRYACAVQISDSEKIATEQGYSASEYLMVPNRLPLEGTIFGGGSAATI